MKNIVNKNPRKLGRGADINYCVSIILFWVGIALVFSGATYIIAVRVGFVDTVLSQVDDLPVKALALCRYWMVAFGSIFLIATYLLHRKAERAQEYLERPTTVPRDFGA